MQRIDIAKVRRELASKIKVLQDKQLETTAPLLIEELISNTPIDTGKARASWSLDKGADGIYRVKNSAPYIGALNAGSSKQAPSHFIESIAMKYGKPIGTIVQEIP